MTPPRALGANTWIWTSPLTDESLAELAPKIRGWGFDVIELTVENVDDWDPRRAAALLDSLGLSAAIVVAMGPVASWSPRIGRPSPQRETSCVVPSTSRQRSRHR